MRTTPIFTLMLALAAPLPAQPTHRAEPLLDTDQGSIIGVSVDPRPRDTDRWGAYVTAVTPGYPADRAGIRAGDIIASVAGQSVTSGRTDRRASEGESLVWLRLSEIVRSLEPGKSVELQYRRDGSSHSARITPIDDDRWFATPDRSTRDSSGRTGRSSPFPGSGSRGSVPGSTRGSGAFFFSARGRAIANLELAPINPKLGAYFGTSRGVLVTSAPPSDNLGLEPGDVVTAVDGRTVDTPGELIRALSSYESGKSFTLHILRQKQQQSLGASLP